MAYAVDCIEQDSGSGAWLKGYNDAHRDFHGLNGHGFDDSTHFKGDDKGHYKSDIVKDLMTQLMVKSYQCAERLLLFSSGSQILNQRSS